ncbi:MAG: hypothetical protein LUG18_08295 [Candidatus Azobacteroides sp.]|nr:hypothetical protein [Candidatus Azobacteroides sp.]
MSCKAEQDVVQSRAECYRSTYVRRSFDICGANVSHMWDVRLTYVER